MTGLCWTPVVLVFLLSAQHSFGAVDQNWLRNIVEALKNEYALGDAFTLAVNIPQNQDPADLKQVLQSDPVDKVKEAVSQGQVYQGTSVIAATQSDGLSRVLENIQSLKTDNQGNVLVIYSEVAPNSNDNSMADKINYVLQNWNAYAFVFSRVADVPTADTSQLAGSFKLLDISKLGLDNIFRCYKPDDSFQCTSCSSGGDVTPSCVANSAPANQEQGTVADTSGDAGTGAGATAGGDTDAGSGADAGAAEGADTGESPGADTGAGTGAGVDAGAGADVGTYTGNGITIGAGTGLGKQGKAGKMRKCKGRNQGCNRKRGSRKRKSGNVRRSRKRGPGRNGRKQGKFRGGGRRARRKGGRRGGKSAKRRGGRGGGKRRGGRGGRKSAKRRGGGKRRKWGNLQDIFWEW
ncbi:nucleolin-like [Salarias fasciatus]|uniref:nucleolin-like n=1 Tax=Salarias fasciatus TaxID=181472 RepID=UPI0011768BC7|nr:nucleolin-like [Salarias fasciatus]